MRRRTPTRRTTTPPVKNANGNPPVRPENRMTVLARWYVIVRDWLMAFGRWLITPLSFTMAPPRRRRGRPPKLKVA